MEFNKKLQSLRKNRGLTQDELAKSLYVSRTAISKWESGRGYPNIESLKAIAAFFSITVDELLSADEALVIAEDSGRRSEAHLRDLIYGLLDLSMVLLFFMPFFASRVDGVMQSSASLLTVDGIKPYLRFLYYTVTLATLATGVVTLALQNIGVIWWQKCKASISLSVGMLALILFTASLQPYAALFSFTLLALKTAILIKRR